MLANLSTTRLRNVYAWCLGWSNAPPRGYAPTIVPPLTHVTNMLPLKCIWPGVLLQLCSAIHNRLFKLAHGDNNRFQVMVFRGIVGTIFSKQFLGGTPRTLCIDPRQFPSTNPSPAHLPTSHATSQALFSTTPTRQNFLALFPTSTPTPFSKHQSQPSPPANLACNLASTFLNQPRPSKSQALFPSSGRLRSSKWCVAPNV